MLLLLAIGPTWSRLLVAEHGRHCYYQQILPLQQDVVDESVCNMVDVRLKITHGNCHTSRSGVEQVFL